MDSVRDLLTDSFTVVRDFGHFAFGHIWEQFPHQLKSSLVDTTDAAKPYTARVGSVYLDHVSPRIEQAKGAANMAHTWVNTRWTHFITPVIEQFESQFPTSAGRMGSSAGDSLLLLVWFMVLLRLTWLSATYPIRFLYRLIAKKPKKFTGVARVAPAKPASLPASRKSTPPGSTGSQTPPIATESKPQPVSPPRETSKKGQTKSPPRTVKKRIVISK